MHDLPTTASERARMDREFPKFFDLTRVGGAEPELDFKDRDQQDVGGYAAYRYQPGYDEDLNALRVSPAARVPVYDRRTDTAALPRSTAPMTMQLPPAHQMSALSGTSTRQHLLAPAGSNNTPVNNARQSQDAPPPSGPQQTYIPTAGAAPQLPQPVSAVPSAGANPQRYLALHYGRPSQGLVWPANIEISLVEICAFCPNWFMIPELVARAIRNGWTREALSKAELHAVGSLDWDSWQTATGRIQKHISAGCKLIDGVSSEDRSRHNSKDFRVRHGPQNDLTAGAWRFKAQYEPGKPVQPGHMPLSHVYEGVVNWPVGNDRLLMTQCLEFAKAIEHLNLDTSHWDWIIRSQGLTAPPAPAGLSRDVDAFQRLNANVDDP